MCNWFGSGLGHNIRAAAAGRFPFGYVRSAG